MTAIKIRIIINVSTQYLAGTVLSCLPPEPQFPYLQKEENSIVQGD